MRFKFKTQEYQTQAVNAVVNCFIGQPNSNPGRYRIDPGRKSTRDNMEPIGYEPETGFRNQPVLLNDTELLQNIQNVQRRQNLFRSKSLDDYKDNSGRQKPPSYYPGSDINLDIEMETGTGKTYCYTKTIFELNKYYGWSKFIIVVPSIAIREGVFTSLRQTADHFAEIYHKKARFFIYDSSQLGEIESFSSNSGINIMIVNNQAFNAPPKENATERTKLSAKNRIHRVLDEFNTRRPIDVIKANNPILILDEPQRLEGKSTRDALNEFNPLFILRYSATHNTHHNLVHRLDAIDAYNHKLVKKIEVRGVETQGIAGTSSYIYLQTIETTKLSPIARIDMQVQTMSGQIKRVVRRIEKGHNLFNLSGNLEAYRDRFVVTQIDAHNNIIEFENGLVLEPGTVFGDLTEQQLRRIQIREAISAHLDKEQSLFNKGIKVLSLFFIDSVVKYRDYKQDDTKGDYARIFEEEYREAVERIKNELNPESPLDLAYKAYLNSHQVEQVHKGYFSIDSNRRLIDPNVRLSTLTTDDVYAYDLIMRDKERLLSFDEPTRFIFSHSALREGWDNPNIFVLCMLKAADPENITTRRQEVGRGLRIAVDKNGVRMDDPATVHDINILTVVANESFSDFAQAMQREMIENLATRPQKADAAFFKGKQITLKSGEVFELGEQEASSIIGYLFDNDYIDEQGHLTSTFHNHKTENILEPLPRKLREMTPQLVELITSVDVERALPTITDGRSMKRNPVNQANLSKKEFRSLWQRINQKAIYRVDFDSDELVESAVARINQSLAVRQLSYVIESGSQTDTLSRDDLEAGKTFAVDKNGVERRTEAKPIISTMEYDLVGKIAENADLTRHTAARILTEINPDKFAMYAKNPEHFISETSRLIKESKAATLIERLSYDLINERYDLSIFTANQVRGDFSKATQRLNKHVYDYVLADSKGERNFAAELEKNQNVEVYSKLPSGFKIPTPVGDYNPDWAIAFTEGSVKHVYFVAETKGDLSSLELRGIEEHKIQCAREFFATLAAEKPEQAIKYDVVATYEDLLDKVS